MMKKNLMPDRLWVSSEPIETGAGDTWLGTQSSDDSPSPSLYVRVETPKTGADKTLAVGQWRWAKYLSWSDWEAVTVDQKANKELVLVDGEGGIFLPSEYAQIGPTISPPPPSY